MESERIKLEALRQHVPLAPHFDTPSFGSALWPYMLLFRPYKAPDFVALQTAYAHVANVLVEWVSFPVPRSNTDPSTPE